MGKRDDAIRRIYKTKDTPFDDLWAWARNGKSKKERFLRFRALQQWAQWHRNNSAGEEREKWNNRRKVYRSRKQRIFTRLNDQPALGTGPNQGSTSLIEACVVPVFVKHGIPLTSRKRWETFGNPSSDHYMGNTDADAADGGIANAQWLHAEIAKAFREAGVPLDRAPTDYASCYLTANGNRYRYQGIAATHGTGPHYHGGVKRTW